MANIDRDSRRRFLRNLNLTLAGGAALSIFPQFDLVGRAMAATQAPSSGYKALVCIFLFGGNDSFNMLLPYQQSEYDAYLGIRGGVYDAASNAQGLGLERSSLLRIADTGGKNWGLHPVCGGLKSLFDRGELAFLANVGTLVVPIDNKSRLEGGVSLPPQLYSHNDQQRLWMRGHSESRSLSYGWGGLSADLLRNPDSTSLPALPPTISLAGNNLFQAGQRTSPFGMGVEGPTALRTFGETGTANIIRREALQALMQRDYMPVMQSHYGAIGESSMLLSSALGIALDPANGGDIATPALPDNNLDAQLRMIARTIKASRTSAINHHRQIFFASLGGFDTHDNQFAAHENLLGQLGNALASFREALNEIGALNDTVTFTTSEFGRTLNSNGNGTDHGWGGVQMIMGGSASRGGPLRGRQVWGNYPVLSLDHPLMLERGRLIPSISNNQMAATLAKWLGVDDGDLPVIFPGIDGFSSRTLGFLG